ncbi:hypothetical protein L1987_64932 [Smallanthus sonchifolius]|uniref:Uncharacterized protein n=1 Tax=Smallanthus sonchifolius TaxID=185202 RepID=A0ACB9BT61_9ASTR|nr:hypothetical protein L1987_64932 [Smallanthus sonchifolius]
MIGRGEDVVGYGGWGWAGWAWWTVGWVGWGGAKGWVGQVAAIGGGDVVGMGWVATVVAGWVGGAGWGGGVLWGLVGWSGGRGGWGRWQRHAVGTWWGGVGGGVVGLGGGGVGLCGEGWVRVGYGWGGRGRWQLKAVATWWGVAGGECIQASSQGRWELTLDEEEEMKVHLELPLYQKAEGIFGNPITKKMREKLTHDEAPYVTSKRSQTGAKTSTSSSRPKRRGLVDEDFDAGVEENDVAAYKDFVPTLDAMMMSWNMKI